jgi:hypothetical protein
MKNKLLHPGQIVALRDYPVRNEQILKIYFRIFSKGQGEILPFSPVIHKSSGIPYMDERDSKTKKYNALLAGFLEEHPDAEYFLMDGSHKATAAALSHRRVPAVVIERNQDFKEAKKLIRAGEIFGWYSVENSIEDAIEKLAKHHFRTKGFLTVEEKTRMLVKDGKLPRYMVSYYRKHA